MASRRQRERLREMKIARDIARDKAEFGKTADLSEEKPKASKSSTAKKKPATTKKRASQKAKE